MFNKNLLNFYDEISIFNKSKEDLDKYIKDYRVEHFWEHVKNNQERYLERYSTIV